MLLFVSLHRWVQNELQVLYDRKQGFTANLTSNQILNQINSLPECDKLTNIVMMGMVNLWIIWMRC